ncbi:MAG: hypothetical protein ACMUJM_07485 [bacterium]
MNSFILEIGGIPITIKSEDSSFVDCIAEKYKEFNHIARSLNGEADAINAAESVAPFQLYMNIRHNEEELSSQLHKEKLWIEVAYQDDRFVVRRPDLEGDIDLVGRVAHVTNRAALYSFDSFLRIMYSLILPQMEGFLVHAASVVKDEMGYVFMGRSGAGKSTIALYSSYYTVLSDEISLIKKIGDQYILYSTPFWGEQEIKGGNFYVPLAGICQLRQNSQLSLRRLGKREALRYLMENILYFAKEPFLTNQIFHNCSDFIEKIDIFVLSFQKNEYFWKIIDF